MLSPPYTYLMVWLWQRSGSRLAWGNEVCYQPLPAGTATSLPQHTPGKTNSVPQRWWCSDINLRAKWAASSDAAGCPPGRGEKIPKLLRVPSTAAPLAQGWDQQPQIKVGVLGGFFPVSHGLPSSCEATTTTAQAWQISNQSSRSKRTTAATACCPHPALPVRTRGALPHQPRPPHPHPTPGDSDSRYTRGQAPPRIPIAKIAASYRVIGWKESRILHARAHFSALTPRVVLSHLRTCGRHQSLGPAKLPTAKIVQGAALLAQGSPGPRGQTMRVGQGESIRASC